MSNHFKELKQNNYSGYLYILKFNQGIKIGITSDFNKRKIGLIKDFGSFEVISIQYLENCNQLELDLHKNYDKYRIVLESGTGRTEFFNHDVLEELTSLST